MSGLFIRGTHSQHVLPRIPVVLQVMQTLGLDTTYTGATNFANPADVGIAAAMAVLAYAKVSQPFIFIKGVPVGLPAAAMRCMHASLLQL
jgi:hypothetical protein